MRERESAPNCTETLLEVEAYLDGEVDPDLATRITEHLSACSPCLDRAEFRKHLKEIVATRCIEKDVPEALRDRIRSIIAEP
jgi:mycothiol system anti-sigma-R factor